MRDGPQDGQADMLEKINQSPFLKKHLETYAPRQPLFLEGDESQDVYMLISGTLEVLKGSKKITDITEQGAIVGEMALIMGGKRTASIRCNNEVQILKIPKEDVDEFIEEFPDFSKRIARILADRLDEATSMVYGLKEISDQFPDSVIMTDEKGRITSWNKVAEQLYGLSGSEFKDRPAEEIFADPRNFAEFLDGVRKNLYAQDYIIRVEHPEKGDIQVSLSARSLVDGHNNFQGVILVGRDVTEQRRVADLHKATRKFYLPLLVLVIMLVGAMIFQENFTAGKQILDKRKQAFQALVNKDYNNLSEKLVPLFKVKDWPAAGRVLADYFANPKPHHDNYVGLTLLDASKFVVWPYKLKQKTVFPVTMGASYSDLDFTKAKKSRHHVLTLYNVDKDNPTGFKSQELAFPIGSKPVLGWLLFRLDMEAVQLNYGLGEEDLPMLEMGNGQ